ncbi:hypothetical protein N7454_010236 [Penicillium verhagenii]|nr:hypothetical protein N7454_010236 [Penicillium verhagenii]
MRHGIFLLGSIISLFSHAHGTPTQSPELAKRADKGNYCPSASECINWYNTGSIACSSGYKKTSYGARGDPGGSFCQRKCTQDELNTCTANKCAFDTGQCNVFPANLICKDALDNCGKPVKMSKSICTKKDMGQPVSYDDKTKTCFSDPNAKEVVKSFNVLVKIDERFQSYALSCEPVTKEGAIAVYNAIKASVQSIECDSNPPDFSNSEVTWRCLHVVRGHSEGLKKAGKAACEKAEYSGDEKPVWTVRT